MRFPRCKAFTRLELMVVLGTLFLLLLVCIPARAIRVQTRTDRMVCVNNLRQIGQAWRTFATSSNDRFPENYSPFFSTATQWYKSISNELSTTIILVCPNDSGKNIALDFAMLSFDNVSYALGFDTGFEQPRTILGLDRNVDGAIRSNTLFYYMPPDQAASVTWSILIHNQQGNLLQTDGSVKQCGNSELQTALRTSGGKDNRVLMP